jgi:hypothetical protein
MVLDPKAEKVWGTVGELYCEEGTWLPAPLYDTVEVDEGDVRNWDPVCRYDSGGSVGLDS